MCYRRLVEETLLLSLELYSSKLLHRNSFSQSGWHSAGRADRSGRAQQRSATPQRSRTSALQRWASGAMGRGAGFGYEYDARFSIEKCWAGTDSG